MPLDPAPVKVFDGTRSRPKRAILRRVSVHEGGIHRRVEVELGLGQGLACYEPEVCLTSLSKRSINTGAKLSR